MAKEVTRPDVQRRAGAKLPSSLIPQAKPDSRTNGWPRVLEVDYSAARAQAIRWLGDRYLLAKPINWNRSAGCKVPLAKAELAVMGLYVEHANDTSGSLVEP
jgi:hypothetical protein